MWSPAARDRKAHLLPGVAKLRAVALAVAKAVARQARMEGQCEPFGDEELAGLIARKLWEPSNGRSAGDCRPEC
jgi:malic enzyme